MTASPLLRHLSRRRLLQGAGALAAAMVLGDACGSSTVSPRPAGGALARVLPSALSAAPSPSPAPLVLTEDLLRKAQAPLTRLLMNDTLALPGGTRVLASTLEAAGTALDASAGNPVFFPNPVAALGLVLAAADWSGGQGALDLSVTLPDLPLTVVRLPLPSLPRGPDPDVLAAATPPGLVLRPGTALLLAGILPDGRAALAVSDPARKLSRHPRLELALLAPATLAPLLALTGAALEPSGTLTLADGTHITLATVDAGLATTLIAGAGAMYVDQVPLQPKGAKPALTADPVVPSPDPTLVPAGSRFSRLEDGRILALDAGGTAVGRAMPLADAPWSWVGNTSATSYLLDYTPREYADAIGVRIGSEFGGLLSDPVGRALYVEQTNLAVIDNGIYWSQIEPERGVFDFDSLDRQLAIAKALAQRIRGSALVFAHATDMLPTWLTQAPLRAADVQDILVTHVAAIVEHCRGQVDEWIVVNEPYFAPNRENDLFYLALGENYIDIAFQTARRSDPAARLIFNDTDNHHASGSVELTMSIAQRLRPKGLLDAIGLEMHNKDLPWVPGGIPTATDVTATIKGYGMPCLVTEFDYDLSAYPGTQAERYARQAAVYAWLIGASLDAGVSEISFWGLDGKDSWLAQTPGADATMFDAAHAPKPAYFAVRDLFRQRAGLG